MKKTITIIYSIAHFLVDLSCVILISNLVRNNMGDTANVAIAILIYDLVAFALQLPIGIIADKLNKNALIACIGCLLVAISYAFFKNGYIAAVVTGLGNALFHVGGGIDVLNISNKKAALSGIFVSTGAMGVFLGMQSYTYGFNMYFIPILLMLFMATILFILYTKIKDKVSNEEMIIPNLSKAEIFVIACLIITVCMRSYVGMILKFSWKTTFLIGLISTFAVIFGKMFGGIIGDRIGYKRISIISLGLSSILFLFGFDNMVCGLLAMLFFNMTMPITLTALSNILNNNKGMAFGMLTLALVIGALPAFFGLDKILFTPIRLFVAVLINAVILYIGIHQYTKLKEE